MSSIRMLRNFFCLMTVVLLVGGEVRAENKLEEIVVTAQKRTQELTDVPISITVVSGEKLKNAGLDSVNDLAMLVPGLRVDQQGPFSQPTIRGVGSSTSGAGFTSNIAIYIDGFYVPNQLQTDMQLLNLSNVQVLKGPQGTLFGRNATGGAIILETESASFEPVFKVQATIADYKKREISMYGSTGVTESVAVDLAVIHQVGDGYLENIATGADDDAAYEKTTARASFLYESEDDLTVEFVYTHSDTDDPLSVVTAPFESQTLAVFFPGSIIATGDYQVANTGPTEYDSESEGMFLTIEKDFGDILFRSLTMRRDEKSFAHLDADSSNATVLSIGFSPESEVFSQEFNLSGKSDKLEWIAGLYYLDYSEKYLDLASLEIPLRVYDEIGTDIESFAMFADATYAVTEKLYITAGIRYSEERAESFVNNHYLLSPPDVVDIAPWNETWDSVTPRLVVRYEADDNSSVYASYSEGFKAGLLLPSTPDITPVDQEEIEAYEIGYKTKHDRYRFSAAAFYYDYTDVQVASFNGVASLVRNAASSTSKGVEIDFSSVLNNGLEINVGAAYTDAKYDKFPGSQPRNLDSTSPTFLQIQPGNANGKRILRTPELTATLGARYEFSLDGGAMIDLNANYFYSSELFFDPNEQFKQGAYGLLNLRATWTDKSDHYSVSLFCNNATDEVYTAQVLPGDIGTQRVFGEPRVIGVTVEYKL